MNGDAVSGVQAIVPFQNCWPSRFHAWDLQVANRKVVKLKTVLATQFRDALEFSNNYFFRGQSRDQDTIPRVAQRPQVVLQEPSRTRSATNRQPARPGSFDRPDLQL